MRAELRRFSSARTAQQREPVKAAAHDGCFETFRSHDQIIPDILVQKEIAVFSVSTATICGQED
jgi:hypothetical protein